MTTVERYRPPRLSADALPKSRPSHSSSSTIANIPPAVPSPPQHSSSFPPRKSFIQVEHSPDFTMAADESSQWIFTDAEILSSPSILQGMPPKDERCLRAKGANFILQAGMLLKLPQITIATASLYFQRFYMRYSLDQSKGGIHHYVRSPAQSPSPAGPSMAPPPTPWRLPRSRSHANFVAKDSQADFESSEQTIAGTALFLATKTEENCRKTKEIVIACAKVAQKNSNLAIDEQSKEYWRWRDNILMYEETMLEFLTFDVSLEGIHHILYDVLHQLHIEENKKIRNTAWAFLNDGCLTTLYLQAPARDIAVGAIYFASKIHGESIPDDEQGNSWWEAVGAKERHILKAVAIMYEFYTENPLKKSDGQYNLSPISFFNEEDIQRSRRKKSNDDSPSPGRSQPMQNGHSQQTQASAAPLVNGASDAALKEAANDPATHISNGDSTSKLNHSTSNPTPKRKNSGDGEEPASKRSKNVDESSEKPTTAVADESEEGELEG